MLLFSAILGRHFCFFLVFDCKDTIIFRNSGVFVGKFYVSVHVCS